MRFKIHFIHLFPLLFFSYLFFGQNKLGVIKQPFNKPVDLVKNYVQKANENSKDAYLYRVYTDSAIYFAKKYKLDSILNKILIDKGNLFFSKGMYDSAMTLNIEALTVVDKLKSEVQKAKIYDNIGLIHFMLRNYRKAIQNSSLALSINKKINNKTGLIHCYNNLGISYSSIQNFDSSLICYEAVTKLSAELKDRKGECVGLSNLALIYGNRKNYKKALATYLTALSIAKQEQDDNMIAYILLNIGCSYNLLNQPNEGIAMLNEAKGLAEKLNLVEIKKNCHLNLAEAYVAKKEFEKAIVERKSYEFLNDSLIDLKKTQQIIDAEAKYKHKEQTTLITSQSNSLKTLKKTSISITLISISVIILILIISFIYFKRIRNRNNAMKQQLEKEHFILSQTNLDLKTRLLKLSQESIQSQNTENITLTTKKTEQYTLSNQEREKILKTTLDFIEEKEPYLKNDLTIEDLSKELNIKKQALSEVINRSYGKNFYGLINIYRVEKAKELLHRNYQNPTMLAVAYDSGFNSKSSFYRVFKENVGITPLEFKAKINN